MDALPTAAVADACVRLKVHPRAVGLRPILPGLVLAGPALPVRHAGSVDVFFEAFQTAQPGSILVIDNRGRVDEGCIGDLTALEARHHDVAAIAVDGCHRDTAALRRLKFPVWSLGAYPFGPVTPRPRREGTAKLGGFEVFPDDVVALDDDGAVFVAQADAERVWDLARRIHETETKQAESDVPLCEQFDVPGYLEKRTENPAYTFREHLRAKGRRIEE
jgi:4-hydroxy-4-methyl-2-oxoglutarate aldolase